MISLSRVVLGICTAVCACACSAPATSPPGAGVPAAARSPGARPPDFELPTLDGGSVRLSDHLGKSVVLIDFWATFCEPCLRAMPHLNDLYVKYKAQGLLVLGVSIDGSDSLPEVRAEVQKLGISFPILLDHETRAVALYNPKMSAPFSVLIDRQSRIRVKREGYTTGSAAALELDLKAALSDAEN